MSKGLSLLQNIPDKRCLGCEVRRRSCDIIVICLASHITAKISECNYRYDSGAQFSISFRMVVYTSSRAALISSLTCPFRGDISQSNISGRLPTIIKGTHTETEDITPT